MSIGLTWHWDWKKGPQEAEDLFPSIARQLKREIIEVKFISWHHALTLQVARRLTAHTKFLDVPQQNETNTTSRYNFAIKRRDDVADQERCAQEKRQPRVHVLADPRLVLRHFKSFKKRKTKDYGASWKKYTSLGFFQTRSLWTKRNKITVFASSFQMRRNNDIFAHLIICSKRQWTG